MTRVYVALIELHAAADALQKAHAAVGEAGYPAIAKSLHLAARLVTVCVGKLIVEESAKAKVTA